MTTTLVISPHLDDAALSLGGSIAAWVAAGTRVVIATMYTAGPPLSEVSAGMRRFADYTKRRAEDAAACATLGAEAHYFDHVERAFRRPFLTGWSFFRTPPDRAGFDTLDKVTRSLQPLVALAPDRIVIPLGIGNHVDHVETAIAATDWAIAANLFGRVSFYEDFYALSGAMRARHSITRSYLWRSRESPLLRARRLAVIMRAIALGSGGPQIDHFFAPPLSSARWSVTASPISADDEQRKLEAIACYGSQTAAFGGFAGVARALRTYHAWWGGAEPLWRAALA